MARDALLTELAAHPKPGLVSHADSGSHSDMSAAQFVTSANALEPFFVRFAAAGARFADMDALRAIGLQAEAAMLRATGGVNTHRGAIFGLGLLAAAAGLRGPGDTASLGAVVRRVWGPSIPAHDPGSRSNGSIVQRRFGVGGPRLQAIRGFPALYDVALPALRSGRRLRPGDRSAAAVHCLIALIATLDDTNLLHRGGLEGARFAQTTARAFLAAGGVARPDWRDGALAMHEGFTRRALSPGGCADLLAMAIFADRLEAERPG